MKKPIKADKKPIKISNCDIIVSYLKNNELITNKEARELLNLADSTTKRLLKSMVDESILIPIGDRKSRKYQLK